MQMKQVTTHSKGAGLLNMIKGTDPLITKSKVRVIQGVVALLPAGGYCR